MPADMTSQSRRQLLNAITDLFLLDDAPSEEAKAHYSEIATHSLTHLESDARKSYADHVAALATLPHAVATMLANDPDSEVARLVLKLSPVLTDSDLTAIALNQSQHHLVAIAERARLPETVTDVLVERGDRSVLQTVSGNAGASLSDGGFDRLLERSQDDADIGLTLSARPDLSPSRTSRVRRAVEGLSDGSKPAADDLALARQARQQRREVRLLLADLNAGKRSLDDVLTMLAEEDRAYHLAQVLAEAASISPEQALRVLMQRDASGIAVACRSLGVTAEAFRAILILRGRRLFASQQDALDEAVDDYAKLDATTAERTLRFLKLRTTLN
jgi:uncharacterized protein (DUF2336 family)